MGPAPPRSSTTSTSRTARREADRRSRDRRASTTHLPSTGSKGGLLLGDSHFEPLRRQGVAADKDPSTLNNLPSRPQSSNLAFGLEPTKPFRVSTFTDTQGGYPGIEIRPNGSIHFRDVDDGAPE